MGSYRRATMTGFLCRLCSSYKDVVIHLYSKRARDIYLLKKCEILPVSIKKYDRLPKTVCKSCIEKVIAQYEYVQQIRKNFGVHSRKCKNSASVSPTTNPGTSENASSIEDTSTSIEQEPNANVT